MDCKSEGIHGVADILPGFGPGDVGSIPTGSVIFRAIYGVWAALFFVMIFSCSG